MAQSSVPGRARTRIDEARNVLAHFPAEVIKTLAGSAASSFGGGGTIERMSRGAYGLADRAVDAGLDWLSSGTPKVVMAPSSSGISPLGSDISPSQAATGELGNELAGSWEGDDYIPKPGDISYADALSGKGQPGMNPSALRAGNAIAQDAAGNQILRQTKDPSFMDRRGAFTGPNNDPTTPGMTRVALRSPEMTIFNEDDARSSGQQARLQARAMEMDREAREEAARLSEMARSEERVIRGEDRSIAREDRTRRISREDEQQRIAREAAMADLEEQRQRLAGEAAWSAKRGGVRYNPKVHEMETEADIRRSITDRAQAAISSINAQETELEMALDSIGSGAQPTPDIMSAFSEAGLQISPSMLKKENIAALKTSLKQVYDYQRLEQQRTASELLGQAKTTTTIRENSNQQSQF